MDTDRPQKPSTERYASLETLILHYTMLARLPGWIDQARYRVRELETDYPGIGKAVAERLKKHD